MSQEFYDGRGLASEEHMRELQSLAHTVRLTEDQRQVVLLSLAELSIARPGWVPLLEEIALLMDNRTEEDKAQMFENFRLNHSQRLAKALAGEPPP